MSSVEQKFDSRTLCKFGVMMLAFVTGCGGGRPANDYIPAANQARQAVEQMLEAWTKGEPADKKMQLSGNGPSLKLFESQRSTKKLAKFEVVREIPATENEPPQVAVKLTFDGQEKVVDATYYVVGIDPLNVFRDVEYQQASGMSK